MSAGHRSRSGRWGQRGKEVARRAGLTGAVLGFAAAGVAAGMALERHVVGRTRAAPDAYADEPFGRLPADETHTVPVDGGVDLHVEVVNPPDGEPPDLTVVFVHGFCLNMGTFHFQRRTFAQTPGLRLRMVFYDQPGHGRSERLPAGEYTLESLGVALRRVIDTVAPEGPLVLVGHSMGGMTVMALAEDNPRLFAERVVGACFISSSAGGLEHVTFGLPETVARFRRPLMPLLTGVNRLTPAVVERARKLTSDMAWLLTRRYGFGGPAPSQALVSYVEQMNSTTSVDVIVGYLHTLFDHLRHEALDTLHGVPTLVICGDRDLITPMTHSEEIARLLPGSELVIIENGGHVALLEFHGEVNEHLLRFLQSARAAVQPPPAQERRLAPRLFRRWAQ